MKRAMDKIKGDLDQLGGKMRQQCGAFTVSDLFHFEDEFSERLQHSLGKAKDEVEDILGRLATADGGLRTNSATMKGLMWIA